MCISCKSTKIASVNKTVETIVEYKDTIVNVPLPDYKVDSIINLDTIKTTPIVIETPTAKVTVSVINDKNIKVEIQNTDSVMTTVPMKETLIKEKTETTLIKKEIPLWIKAPFFVFIGVILTLVVCFVRFKI